jgi:small subunit ribosomal protein S1
MREATVYHSKVAGYNKGGLIVRFGKVRGFVPASQISLERRRRSDGNTPEERWGNMVGEEIMTKVIEVDRGRNRLILSERAASKEIRASRREALLQSLEVGQVHKGRVISLADFGAFVDLGGADGLISVDRERQRIGLSCKRCQPDPWSIVVAEYQVDQLVQGTITKLTKFGAFARLVDHPEIEGLIHISELSEQRVNHPREVVAEGDVMTLRIVRIDSERRRMGLSLKRVNSERYLDTDWYIEDETEPSKPDRSRRFEKDEDEDDLELEEEEFDFDEYDDEDEDD